MERVKSLDLYLLLEVEQDADAKTIKKAYRRKALTCHPDKNPDNKQAVELFHQLSDALEVLTDEATRLAYDNLLKARKAAELRMRKLDGKRRKLKEELEEREKNHTEELVFRYNEEDKLAKEIERLRKEGSRQLEEEQEAMRKQMKEEKLGQTVRRGQEVQVGGRVKVKWDKKAACQYNKENLERIFLKYGSVTAIVINEKKGGSALVEFEDIAAARMAVNIETGFLENKLKVKPLWEEANSKSEGVTGVSSDGGCVGGVSNDFESLVMRKLRQEEERKRLIQKIMDEDS